MVSVEEFHGQVVFEKHLVKGSFQINDRKPNGIACPIVMHIGSLQANLAIRYLAGLMLKKMFYIICHLIMKVF